jgi:hypothetical protein
MTRIPAECMNPACGYVFPSGFSGGPKSEFRGNVTTCRKCGSPALVADGRTGITPETFSPADARSAATWEKARQYSELLGLAQRVQAGKMTGQAAVAQAQTFAPRGARALSLADSLGIMSVLIALLALLQTYYSDQSSDRDHAEEMILGKQTLAEQQVQSGYLKQQAEYQRRQLLATQESNRLLRILGEKLPNNMPMSVSVKTQEPQAAPFEGNRDQRRRALSEAKRKRPKSR